MNIFSTKTTILITSINLENDFNYQKRDNKWNKKYG